MNKINSVTIIVPVYNAEATIEECIQSILSLNYPKEKLEIIFVNNNSSDNTEKILQKYSSWIKIFFEEKKGPAAARNKGLKNASGSIIAFTDSDCKVDKEWLIKLISPLEEEEIGITGGRILSDNPDNKIEKYGEIIHDHNAAINIFNPPYVITMNWASRLEVLQKMNFFNEDFIRCEDVELSLRIFTAGYKIKYVPDAVIYHKNERTLPGLFREGYQHGLYSVQFIKEYKSYISGTGHSKINLNAYREILKDLKKYFSNGKEINSICSAAFNSGKKLGKIFGSLRFAHLDL